MAINTISVPSASNNRGPSTLENIAAGVDIAAKILGTGIDAYKTFGIERPKQKLLEETTRADIEASKLKGQREAQAVEDEFAKTFIPSQLGARGSQVIPGRQGQYTFREKPESALDVIAKSLAIKEKQESAKEAQTKYKGDLAPLNEVPKASREEGVKELGALKAHGSVMTDAISAYDDLNKMATASSLAPGWMGGSKAEYDATRAKLAAALMARVPGIRSDKDFQNIVDPLLPGRLDSDEEKAAKSANFRNWLKSQTPSSPILDSANVDTNKILNVKDPEIEEAKKWLKDNPNHPLAPQIRLQIGEK